MSETEGDAAPTEGPQQPQQLSSPSSGPDEPQPAAPAEPTNERAAEDGAARVQYGALSGETSLDQFRMRKFFVLRVKT